MNSPSHFDPQSLDNSPSAPLPIIEVDGFIIDEGELAAELQYHQNPNFDLVVQQAGQALVVKQVLRNYALKEGLEVTSENEEESVQKLLSEKISYNDPTEEDCVRYFENNRSRFTTVPLLEVDHILLAAAKDDPVARELAKSNATNILSQLQHDASQFAELAKEYSACPSKNTGGSLGQISKGQTVPEFERQLMMLPPGLASQAIESRFGYHVVQIKRKIEGKPLEYEMVASKVKGYLIHRASNLAIQAFIYGLVEKADITGINIKFIEENIHI